MASVLLTGGTGTLGRMVEQVLANRGVQVRILSRKPAPAGRGPGTWIQADLSDGGGLAAAVDGVDTIVHCATSPRGDETAARRLVTAAAHRAGLAKPHLLYVSIVGVDRIPLSYYRAKVASEQVVERSGLPWTIVRVTQFHDRVFKLFAAQRRLPVVLAPAFGFQPIDVRDVAAYLAELVGAGPAGRSPDIGGPMVYACADLARYTLYAFDRRPQVASLRLPGRLFAAFRAGHNLVPGNPVGQRTFLEFANEQVGRV